MIFEIFLVKLKNLSVTKAHHPSICLFFPIPIWHAIEQGCRPATNRFSISMSTGRKRFEIILTIGSGAFLDVLQKNTEQAIGLLISHLANLLKAFTLCFETVKLQKLQIKLINKAFMNKVDLNLVYHYNNYGMWFKVL